jgi:hypothetical protein
LPFRLTANKRNSDKNVYHFHQRETIIWESDGSLREACWMHRIDLPSLDGPLSDSLVVPPLIKPVQQCHHDEAKEKYMEVEEDRKSLHEESPDTTSANE